MGHFQPDNMSRDLSQSAGLSSTLEDQLKQVLEIVANGLQSVARARQAAISRKIKEAEDTEARERAAKRKRERILNGTWHDGRLDCVSGNGIMSELGVGDERLGDDDDHSNIDGETLPEKVREEERRKRDMDDGQSLESLPIVVMKNYAAREGANKEELLGVLAQWAATLAENQVSVNRRTCGWRSSREADRPYCGH